MNQNQPDRGAVLITGTSTGIGRASALLLDESGYRVFAGVRREQDAESLRAEAKGPLEPVILDICKPDHIAAAVEKVSQAIGPQRGLRALVNNAGICEPGPIESISMERFRKQMEINVICHVAVIQAFLPMVRREPGRIVNVTSAVALSPLPCLGAYAASKSAMEGLSDVLRRELRRWNIPVSMVEPGTVETPMWDTTADSPDKAPETADQPELTELYRELNQQVYEAMQQGRRAATDSGDLARVVKQAIEARRPRARYQKGPGAKSALFGRQLPERVTDFFIDNVLRKRLPTSFLGW